MERSRVAACIVVVALLAPLALAASGLLASELVLTGTTRVEGDAAALLFVARDDAVSWDVRADSATLVREYATFVAADTPLHESYVVSKATEWQTETIDVGALTIASSGTLPDGALLVRAEQTTLRASSPGLVEVRAVEDPLLGQVVPADVETEGGDRGEIVEEFVGEFLRFTFSEGAYTLTGELTLRMFGPGYALTSDGSTTEWQTGEYETSRTAVYAEGRQERHTLILHNAVFQVHAAEPTTILMGFAAVDVDGTLAAPEAEGALTLGTQTLTPPPDGSALTYAGAAALALAPQAGRVSATAPAAGIATAGAIAAQGPPLLVLASGAFLLLAGAIAAVVAYARRSRRDDLELALLAMEERRWEDALPRLTRVAKREPANAGVLIDRALCLEQVGRFQDAAKAFESALRSSPQHAEAHFYYARTLAKMREREAARAHLEEALERDPRLVEMARAESVLKGL